jgi:hypothetical protein
MAIWHTDLTHPKMLSPQPTVICFLLQPLGRASDRAFVYGHHWYPSKLQARLALMWYCLYAHSNEQWRMKWLLFLMGEGNNEVEVCQKKFDDNNSTFALNLEDVVV